MGFDYIELVVLVYKLCYVYRGIWGWNEKGRRFVYMGGGYDVVDYFFLF